MAEATETKREPVKGSPPYVPFKTFQSSLDTLKHGIPNQIDRTVFPSLAGVTQSQLLSAFRFFGLITPEGKPTPELAKLIDDKERPALLKKLLEKGYPGLFALGLANASPGSFDTELRKSGLTGDTHDKAKSFFLQAAKYAGVSLSTYLLKVTRTSSPRKRRAISKFPDAANGVNGNPATPSYPAASGPTKAILLDNGISLFLGASADLFRMTGADRTFVLSLLDQMEKYEADHPHAEPEEEDDGEEQVED